MDNKRNIVLITFIVGIIFIAGIHRLLYKPYLNSVNQNEVAFNVSNTEESIKQETLQSSSITHTYIGSESSVDLNGDGITDKIGLEFTSPPDYSYDKLGLVNDGEFTLKINNASIKESGINVRSTIYIVDIDISDNLKEIAIEWLGPSSDERTAFYYFDGKEIIPMGTIVELCGDGHCLNGHGIVRGLERSDFLATWFYKVTYNLTSSHVLQKNSLQDFYDMNRGVVVKQSVKLQKSPTNTEKILTLEVGDKAKIRLVDLKKWAQVENLKGIKGWFSVEDDFISGTQFNPHDVFEGIFYAD